MKALLGLVAVCVTGMLVTPDAEAHGRRARLSVGLHFGAPLYWHPWPAYHYYPAPVYVAPSVVQVAPPVTYVERHDPPVTDQQGWWYYCVNKGGYYPYVKECPGGWQKVPPAPPQ